MLPATPEDTPDYDYMECYIKQLEYQKLKAYCKYKGVLDQRDQDGKFSLAGQLIFCSLACHTFAPLHRRYPGGVGTESKQVQHDDALP